MKKDLSPAFVLVSVFFTVCLIASNLFATKIFSLAGINLPGAVVIFPISYILNDCLAEVWGYRKARLIIWTGFLMNLFVVLAAQLVVWLPPHLSGMRLRISTMFFRWLPAYSSPRCWPSWPDRP